MNRRQRKKKKAQVFTIILGCTAFCKAEQYEKMRKSVEYQLRTGSVVMLPAYLHVEAIIKQRPVSAGVVQTRRNQCSNLLPLGTGIAGFG